MWIIALYSNSMKDPISVKRNLSKQPLRFDNKAYAERTAFELNQVLSPFYAGGGFSWVVMEDNNFYDKEIVVDCE